MARVVKFEAISIEGDEIEAKRVGDNFKFITGPDSMFSLDETEACDLADLILEVFGKKNVKPAPAMRTAEHRPQSRENEIRREVEIQTIMEEQECGREDAEELWNQQNSWKEEPKPRVSWANPNTTGLDIQAKG